MFEYETHIKKKWLEGHGLRQDEIHLRETYRRAEAEQRRKASRSQGSRVKHLKDINMSWSMHLWYALTLAGRLFLLSLTALVHGIFPFILVHSVSDKVKSMAHMFNQEALQKNPH